eukprot:CAMPEP_0202462166 /NCGR_PEP_ID=MMETSP1360-20130828/52801_1 /ASSEMBLY_ACC=CAM_ASM_000848 /TAXON_ID=515479 /ORGANISM="Licmophora paradoxa, Strain CCMP2313" /LENGTH=74 /DNA_ID=CAMNT_0049084509 /DNA_START=131 /DNA_END=355 /DNA_ORIENTATION=-
MKLQLKDGMVPLDKHRLLGAGDADTVKIYSKVFLEGLARPGVGVDIIQNYPTTHRKPGGYPDEHGVNAFVPIAV